MGDANEDMYTENEQKGNKNVLLENKKELTVSEVIEEMNKLGFEKYHQKQKVIMFWILDRLNNVIHSQN